jgi:predicted nucleic-acid-binding protein
MATRAKRYLESATDLVLTELVVAESVYVLGSVYGVPRPDIARMMRAAIALPNVLTEHDGAVLRALELFETGRLDFAEACLVGRAELQPVARVASFDRAIDKVGPTLRIEP